MSERKSTVKEHLVTANEEDVSFADLTDVERNTSLPSAYTDIPVVGVVGSQGNSAYVVENSITTVGFTLKKKTPRSNKPVRVNLKIVGEI